MTNKLKRLLETKGVKYELLQHARTFTALETAEATHIDGRELAKTVIVRIDDELQMVVVPATHQVDLAKLQMLTGSESVELADEDVFAERFDDCQRGAMPPFGELYGMKLRASDALLVDDEIVFNAGTHTDAIRISLADYLRAAAPLIQDLSRPRELV